MLFPLFEQFSDTPDEELRAQFRGLTTKDIRLKMRFHRPNHTQYEVKFKDKELYNIFRRLMREEFLDDQPTRIDVVRESLNRLHVDGIAAALRGIGLGKLIYRAAIKELGMISTALGASSDSAQRVWDSLCKDPAYYYFHDTEEEIRVLVLKKYVAHYEPEIRRWFTSRHRELFSNYEPQ